MHKLLLLISTILFGALWGAVQGMVMIQAKDKMAVNSDPEWYHYGVRNHRWFGIYHRLCLYCVFVFAELILLLAPYIQNILEQPLSQAFLSGLFLTGCGLLGWEASESLYSYARYGVWIGQRENIIYADVYYITLSAEDTLDIHIGRLFGGLTLVVSTLLMNIF
jgi:hypothetical protein